MQTLSTAGANKFVNKELYPHIRRRGIKDKKKLTIFQYTLYYSQDINLVKKKYTVIYFWKAHIVPNDYRK